MNHRRVGIAAACVLWSWSPSHADTVYLKNGAYIDGIVKARNTKVLEVEIGRIGKLEVPLEEIHEIEKNNRTGDNYKAPSGGKKLDLQHLTREGAQAEGKEAPGAGGPGKKEGGAAPDAKAGGDSGAQEEGESAGEGEPGDEVDEDAPKIDPELKARIEQLVEDLQRQKPQFRVRAERHLRSIGPPCLPFILPLVAGESEMTRVAVMRLIYDFGDESVIDACIGRLLDPNDFVRDYANKALERVTHESFGFSAGASPRRREIAHGKWKKWWEAEKEELRETERLKKKK